MKLEAVILRNATQEDVQAVVRIINEAIDEGRNAFTEVLEPDLQGVGWFNDMIEKTNVFLVAEVDGQAVAWGSLTPYRMNRGGLAESSEITFYVSGEYRSRGVASTLIKTLETRAEDLGKRHLIAILLDNNTPSKSLLTKMGYHVWANFEGIVHHRGSDLGHMYMGKHLEKNNL